MLQQAALYVKPGGRIVYVTCSLLQEENEARVAHFLGSRDDFVLRPPQDCPERFLADQQKFQRRPHVQRGTDQQPQVRQGVAVQEVGFVEDQQQGAFGPRGPFQDLFVNAFFAAARRLPQLRDDQLQQARRGQVGEVAVEGLAVLRQQAVQEAFQEGGFTDSAGTGD